MQTATQDTFTAHPAFAESAAHLTSLLHGLISRWETLDFTVSANCFGLEGRLQAWQEADAAALPQSYERQ
jgi:hypothetical protein